MFTIYKRSLTKGSERAKAYIARAPYIAVDNDAHLRTIPVATIQELLDTELIKHKDFLEDTRLAINYEPIVQINNLQDLPTLYPELFI